jgi:glycosyltransferase involved in cell wall biosynthesis
LGAGWTLFRRLSRHDVLVAKTDPPLMSVVAGLVAMLTGAKLVNWLQDLFPEVASASGLRAFDGTLGRLIRGLRNHSLRQATMNVAIGQRMADLLRTGIGIPAERVTVIHNWADGDAIRPGEIATNPLRRQWGLANKFVVGYSGNMGRVHEFGAILDAATQLRNEHDIVFLFIGSGQQRDFIKQSARERGLGNVFFKPYQDEASLSKSLAAPDVHLISLKPKLEGLVVPSKFYGIAAAGRPMLFVGDQTGEAASMIASADCGHSFSTSDGAGLAQAILQLRDDANERQRLGRNARNAFDQYYRRDLALDQWQTLLAGALHR